MTIQTWSDARAIRIHGPAAADFLQGYLTCDTARLGAEPCVPMAMCNLKGRVVANGWALAAGEDVDLIVHESLVAAVEAYFKPYIAFAQASLDAGTAQAVFVDQGDTGVQLVPLSVHVVQDSEASPGSDASDTMNDALIEAGFALVTNQTTQQHLPQVLGMETHQGIDFDKGCYLGQEIVARTQYRGTLKRGLVHVPLDNAAQVGDAYVNDEGQKGAFVSVGSRAGLAVANVPLDG